MLINYQEYQAMFEVEDQMWWYKILHEKAVSEIKSYFGNQKDIKILDAGCGTGGLISILQQAGYNQIEGFDFNEAAVEFSRDRNLNVSRQDITHFSSSFPKNSFDVVISNDVLYQFDNRNLLLALSNIKEVLKPGGIFITNNQAFKIFEGTHDIAVGAKRRFVKADFIAFFRESGNLEIIKSHYWPFLLSPLILSVRLIQKLKLKLGWVNEETIQSDVSMPSVFVNNILFRISKLEMKLIKKPPFGSSLFLVVRKY